MVLYCNSIVIQNSLLCNKSDKDRIPITTKMSTQTFITTLIGFELPVHQQQIIQHFAQCNIYLTSYRLLDIMSITVTLQHLPAPDSSKTGRGAHLHWWWKAGGPILTALPQVGGLRSLSTVDPSIGAVLSIKLKF